jgi:5'-nucleotidase
LVSGVNGGLNLGINVLYSGTVAGATEGALCGIPSVAVSLEYDERPRFDEAAELAVRLIEQILKQGDAAPHPLYNINIPTASFNGTPTVRVVPMASVPWAAEFDRRIDPKGRRYYWATGTAKITPGDELTDLEAWQQGFVTLTPLRIDRTEPDMLARMRSWQLSSSWQGR